MSKWAELVEGSGVGALASEILKVLIEEAKVVLAFKSVSKDLASTMEDLLPILTTIEALQKHDELKTLMDTINRAGELVCICSGVKGWELHKKSYYTRKVWKIQKEMVSFCHVQLQLIQLRNQLQSMEEIRKLKILTEEINNNHQIIVKELKLLMIEVNKNCQINNGQVARYMFGHSFGVWSVPSANNEINNGQVLCGSSFGVWSVPSAFLCMVPKFYKAHVGLDLPLMELKKKVLDDSLESLLVFGPRWCGKTMLVTQLCHDKDIKGKFKHIFFNVVSSTLNFRKLVNDLLQRNYYKPLTSFANDSEIRFALKNLLEKLRKYGPILLVFDDVWSEAESLLENFSIDIPDLKILVTSRTHFPGFDSIYHLKPLNDEDARALQMECDQACLLEHEELLKEWSKGDRIIGRGTFGSVYAADNMKTGEECVMKEVEFCLDDPESVEFIKQLEQEIKLLSNLQHPNIVQYFGSKIVDNRFFIYLERAPSGLKDRYIHEHCGSMAESVVRNITRDILSGLAYLHYRKTVHGDLKGSKIRVDEYWVVKLADFGIAQHLTRRRAELSLNGSTYWMAPELMQGVMQEDSNPDLVFAVDIWSLGCTIIEMLTGKPPKSDIEGVMRDSPPVPESVSAEGKDFLRLCLQRNPAERPTASMLLEHRFINDRDHPPMLHQNKRKREGSTLGAQTKKARVDEDNREVVPENKDKGEDTSEEGSLAGLEK